MVLSPSPARLSSSFFDQGTIAVARSLLGAKLVTNYLGVETSGMIVEVEAYLGSDDPACHAARGKTPRNEVMFRAPGHCYVYLIYGMYHCVNVVTDPEGTGSAVLIRALEPLSGVDAMQRRRGGSKVKLSHLTRGPGRLCEALSITTSLSGHHFDSSPRIWLEPYQSFSRSKIKTSGRIGISAGKDLPLRFFLAGNPWVSAAPTR
jgi:DNA-3-methyladenine glycosylase